MKNKKRLFGVITSISLMIPLFACGQSPHTHVYVAHNEVPSNCCEHGTEFYYSCEGCKDLFDAEKNKIDAPIELPLDPQTHKGTKVMVVTNATTNYKIGDTFDLESATVLWKCEHCDGIALTATEKANLTVTYPTPEATSFTIEDSKSASVEVNLSLNAFSTNVTVRVGKKDNEIIGLEDMDVHCGFPITEFDRMIQDTTISATSGNNIDLYFSDTIDGEYTKRSDMSDDTIFNVRKGETESVYFVKAETRPSDEYSKAEAGPVAISVTHNELEWDTARSDYDFVGCLCDETRVHRFNKVATNVTDIILSEATATLDLTGSDYLVEPYTDLAIEEIYTFNSEHEEVALGSSLTIDVTPFAENGIFGNAEVFVVVSHGDISDEIVRGTHLIRVPVLVVTKKIATLDEWLSIIPTAADTTTTGYFELTNDIVIPKNRNLEWISGWDRAVFSGTIEGNGHTIKSYQCNYGLFYLLKNATIQNVSFVNEYWDRTELNKCVLTQKALNCTFSGLSFSVSACNPETKDTPFEPVGNYGYLFNNGGIQGDAFIDCSFDFDGYVVPCLLCHSNNSSESITFTNCELLCVSVTELYSTETKSITEAEGLTIKIREVDIIDRVEFSATESQVSITLPEKYKDATVISAKFTHVGEQFAISDISSFEIPKTIKNDVSKHGPDSAVVILLESDSKEVVVTVPVTIVTKVINTNDELSALTHISGSKTTVYGYYILGNDLNLNSNYTDFVYGSIMFNTFSGTFDGAGHTITSKSRTYGIFGELIDATIKNVTIKDAWCYGGVDGSQSVISQDMTRTTLDSVNVTMTAKADRDSQFASLVSSFDLTKQNYGWISGRICHTCTFKNCNFDGGTTLKVITLIGTHSSCINAKFVNSTFKCNEYYCIYQSSYTKTVTTTIDGLSITGTCVY